MSKKIALFSLLSILFAQLHSTGNELPRDIITGFVALTTGVFTYRFFNSYVEEEKLNQKRWKQFNECLDKHGPSASRIECYRKYIKNFVEEPSLSN